MKNTSLRSYLLAGMVVWLPVIVTFLVVRFIIELLDNTIALLPYAYQPQQLFGMNIPGLGVIFSLILLLVTGIIAKNILGQRLVSWSESLLEKIPLVRSIYNTAKKVIQAVFSSNGNAFRKVLLVEYPRKGMWSIAFQTGEGHPEANDRTGLDLISVFIPTTPNPTSGFLMMVPKSDAIELDMSTDEALRYVISLGVMQPSKPIVQQANGL